MLPDHSPILHIHPTSLAAAQSLERDLSECRQTQNHTTFGVLFRSFDAPAPLKLCGQATQRALVRESIKATPQLEHLAFDAYRLRSIHKTFGELRRAGLTARHLNSVQHSEIQQLGQALEQYENLLTHHALTDEAEMARFAVHALSENRMPAFLQNVRHVYVYNGTLLQGAPLDLLNQLATRGAHVDITLPIDLERGAIRKTAFAFPEATLAAIESRGHPNIKVAYDDLIGQGHFAAVRAAQFTNNQCPTSHIALQQVRSQSDQEFHIANTVRGWLHQGVSPNDIAIVTIDHQNDAPLIIRALADMKIPCRTNAPNTLAQTPGPQLLGLFAQMVSLHIPRELLAAFLVQIEYSITSSKGVISAPTIAAILRQAGVRSERVSNYRTALAQVPNHHKIPVAEQLGNFLEKVSTATRDNSFTAHCNTLRQATHHLTKTQSAIKNLLNQRAVNQWEHFLCELEFTAGLLPHEPWSAEEFIQTILLLTEEVPIRSGTSPSGVVVAPLEQIVGTRFRCVLFLPPATGDFPRTSNPDANLSDDMRGVLNRAFGARLSQYAATAERDVVRGDAKDTWLWLELLATVQDELKILSLTNSDSADESESSLLNELARSMGKNRFDDAAPLYNEDVRTPRQALSRWAYLRSRKDNAYVSLNRVLSELIPDQLAFLHHRSAVHSTFVNPQQRAQLGTAAQQFMRAMYRSRVLSTSRLDDLGTCRFRHFARTILRLQADRSVSLGADAVDQGRLAHAALEVVYRDILEHGGLAAARHDYNGAIARARDIFTRSHSYITQEVVIHPVLRDAALEEAWSIVQTQLFYDLNPECTHDVVAVEFSFGEKPQDQADLLTVEDASHPPIKIRGSIDRIDVDGDHLLTLDYKRTRKKRTHLRHFQLPIYASVASKAFAQLNKSTNTAWVELLTAKRVHPTHSEMQILDDTVKHAFFQRVADIENGIVRPDPDPNNSCNGCDFHDLCRIDDAHILFEGEE